MVLSANWRACNACSLHVCIRFIARLYIVSLCNRPSTPATQGLENGRNSIGLRPGGAYAGLKYVRCRVGYQCIQNGVSVLCFLRETVCVFLFIHAGAILSKAMSLACICVDMRS
jgi:hypothetical protein